MLEWDGVWISIGESRVRVITPSDIVEALNDISGHHDAWRSGPAGAGDHAGPSMMLW